MAIFKRMSDIITANINDLLDRAENPAKMIKQAIREMEEGVRAAKRSATKTVVAEKKLRKELEQNKRLAQEWQNKAIQAVDADRDDLAKEALHRKREAESLVKSLEPQHEEACRVSRELKTTIQALESRLAEARRKQAALVARKEAADVKKALSSRGGVTGNQKKHLDAFTKMEEMERRVEDAEMEADAAAEIHAQTVEIDSESDGADTDIEIELEKLKQAKRKKQDEG